MKLFRLCLLLAISLGLQAQDKATAPAAAKPIPRTELKALVAP